MSQGTFYDTLIQLKALKRIFVFRPKNQFFFEELIHDFLSKSTNFEGAIFHLFMSLGNSAFRKTSLGIIFKCKERPDKEFSV